MSAETKTDAVVPADTAASVLPLELLIVVLALTHPSPKIAAASKLLATIFRSPSSLSRNAWIQHFIFYDPEGRDQCTDAWHTKWNPSNDGYGPQNAPYIGARHLYSALPCFLCGLKWNVYWFPQTFEQDYFGVLYTTGWSCGPEHVLSRSQLLGSGLVDHLLLKLSNARGGDGDLGSAADSQLRRHFERFKHLVALDTIKALLVQPKPLHKSWDPLFDLITLCHFFMRSWNFDLLHYTLAALAESFPTLPSYTLETSYWLAFAVDDHNSFGFILDDSSLSSTEMTFSEYFTFMAMSQWSVPMIETVLSALGTSFQPPAQEVFDVVLECIFKVSVYHRPARMLHWLRAHGFSVDPIRHRSLSAYIEQYSHYLDFFHVHDVHNLDALRNQNGTQLAIDIRGFALRDGIVDALWVGLEYELVSDEYVKGMILELIHDSKYDLLGGIVGVIADKFGSKDQRTIALIHPVFVAPTFNLLDPTPVGRLLDLLAEHDIPIE